MNRDEWYSPREQEHYIAYRLPKRDLARTGPRLRLVLAMIRDALRIAKGGVR